MMLPWKKVLYVKIDNIHIDKLTYKQQNGDMKIYVDVSPIYLISYKKYPHIYRETDALHHKNIISLLISRLRQHTTYSSATNQKYFVRFVLWVVYDKFFHKAASLQKAMLICERKHIYHFISIVEEYIKRRYNSTQLFSFNRMRTILYLHRLQNDHFIIN